MTNEVTKPEKQKAAGPAAAIERKPAPPARLPMLLIGIVALSAVIVSGYVFHELKQVQQRLDSLGDTQGRLTGIEASLNGLQSDNNKLRQSLAEQAAKQESLAAGLASASRQSRNDDRNWLLADIEHLLTIAAQRLTLDRDVPVALAALQSADNRLRDYNDPELLPLRRQITADINSLQAVNPVDISGLSLYLLDISARVEKLPLKALPRAKQAAPDTVKGNAEKTELPAWRRFADEVIATLKSQVQVYHKGEGPAPLLPDQRYYLYQNLRLQLETASRAVLHRETQNFHTSVKIIQDWLHDNFDTDDPAVNNIIEALGRMSKIELKPELPDISSSLEAVKALVRELPSNGPNKSETPDTPAQ